MRIASRTAPSGRCAGDPKKSTRAPDWVISRSAAKKTISLRLRARRTLTRGPSTGISLIPSADRSRSRYRKSLSGRSLSTGTVMG